MAEATIGIVVDDTDTRGCGAIDADPPAEPGTTAELCSLAIGYESSGSATPLILLESGTTLATDAEGNLYFAGTFQGVIDLGVGPSAHQATDSGFVAKYDASCTPVWTTILGDVESESQVELRALDVAPDGTVVVGGKVGGPIDLNGHALSPSRPSVLVMSLDGADGTVSWVASYESPHNDSMIYQLAVDGAGEIVLGGQAGGDLVIDGVTIEGPEDGLMDFMAKVSASGHYRFGYELKGADASRFAVRDDGKIALTSWAWGDVQLGPADEALFESTFTHRFVALLDADGLSEWGRLLDPDLSWGDTTWSPGTVAFDSEGNVLVEHGNLGTAASLGDHEPAELLSKYDEGGQLLWSRAISPRTWRSNQAPEGGIATDSRGNIVQTLELPDYGQAMPAGYSALPDDVFVQKLRGDGSVVWQHRFATDVYENAFGVTVAPDDSIWVGHGVDPSYQPGTGTLRITKLAP